MSRPLSATIRWYGGRALNGIYRSRMPLMSPWAKRQLENRSYSRLLVPPERLEAVYVEAIDWLAEQRGGLDADYLEFGVCTGASMIALHNALQKRPSSSLRFIGFDSFEGLPESAPLEDGGVWKAGSFMADETRTRTRLKEAGIPDDKLRLEVGWFSDTLTDDLKKELGTPALIMVDCDIYSASAEALQFCATLIDGPTVIIFDDWNSGKLADKGLGQFKAWNETLEANPRLREVCEMDSYRATSRVVCVDVASQPVQH